MCQKPRYFVVKSDGAQILWGYIYAVAETLGYTSNDFIGCRTYTASNGNIVVKMATV